MSAEVDATPCPFCGSPIDEDDTALGECAGRMYHQVACPRCNACGPEADTEAEAFALWNRAALSGRAAQSEPVAYRWRERVDRGRWTKWVLSEHKPSEYPISSGSRLEREIVPLGIIGAPGDSQAVWAGQHRRFINEGGYTPWVWAKIFTSKAEATGWLNRGSLNIRRIVPLIPHGDSEP